MFEINDKITVEIEFAEIVTGTVIGFEKQKVQVRFDNPTKMPGALYRTFEASELTKI